MTDSPAAFAAAPMPFPVLSAAGLTKTYGAAVALAGVDVAIAPGESVAIMGASGSGKTTLLHCLAGIVRPDAGSVVLATPHGPLEVTALGEAERSRLRRESFGFVFQQGLLLPELTAVENVALPLMLAGIPRAGAEQNAASWLAALGLAGLEQRRIGQLSGGQAQRVAIARAQVGGASVVFADEPTGALDSRTSAEVMEALIGSTTGRGRSLIVVTHDDEVAARCSRVLRLADGRIVEEARTPQPHQQPHQPLPQQQQHQPQPPHPQPPHPQQPPQQQPAPSPAQHQPHHQPPQPAPHPITTEQP